MAKKTPQQKKSESYAHDRRNGYGENSKSSRKNIRRTKRVVRRVNRKRVSQILSTVQDGNSDTTEAAEIRIQAKRPKTWEKHPDQPLAEHVISRLVRRVKLGIDSEASAADKVKRLKRNALRKP
jgi:hypothetical protein